MSHESGELELELEAIWGVEGEGRGTKLCDLKLFSRGILQADSLRDSPYCADRMYGYLNTLF